MVKSLLLLAIGLGLCQFIPCVVCFAPTFSNTQNHYQMLSTVSRNDQKTILHMVSAPGRSSPRYGKERSKRQERVGHLVRTELANIIHGGTIRGDADFLNDELRQRISIVNADVSPDLKQARISISVRSPGKDKKVEGDPAVDKRRAYSWLVRNTKPIRHTLAQRMSHMKACPNLMFHQVDVEAAVDVMYLIEKVAKGYGRNALGYDNDAVPTGVVDGFDFDESFDDDEFDWDEEEDEFFE